MIISLFESNDLAGSVLEVDCDDIGSTVDRLARNELLVRYPGCLEPAMYRISTEIRPFVREKLTQLSWRRRDPRCD